MPICCAPSTSMSARSPSNNDSSARTATRLRAAMGVDEREAKAGRQRRFVQAERLEEVREPDGGRHFTMIERAQSLRLPPAGGERFVARLELDVGRVRSQDRVQHPGRGANRLTVD